MVEIEIDGKLVEVKEGSTVIQAAQSVGTYIPHFCYHKKLSIAANCRMCLVEVEKAPKPVPACATPVNKGMKVFTRSQKAVDAQKSVMEFLLINHPLDCPICDQGGECQLQDLTMGYAKSTSRYSEEKRVVFHKNVGPLISMEEMSRCIHCTRCVRFGQEIAGVMELGMINRGEHSEITSFVGKTVDSEMSGNMIDICPVGALTSKPFRYAARTWELGRKKSLSPHDSLGSNTVIQTKSDRVMRVVPHENEAINECWISDKDRFAYEGLNSEDRVEQPLIKQNGQWHEVDWQAALEYVTSGIAGVKADHGPNSVAALAHPMSSVEELFLLQKMIKQIGSKHIETRLRQLDPVADMHGQWLGMPIAELETLQRALVIGSFLRKDHPLLAARLRKAEKTGLQLMRLDSGADDWLIKNKSIVAAPSHWVAELQAVAVAIAAAKSIPAPAGLSQTHDTAKTFAAQLMSGERKGIFIGNTALSHPQASQLIAWSQWIADQTGAHFGFFGEGANFVGAQLINANGDGVQSILDGSKKAVVLYQVEPLADLPNPQAAKAALMQAQTVIAMSSFISDDLLELADVILPITPYSEQAGTYINIVGDIQTVQASVKPLGQARPGWKVLRVLGDLLKLEGFLFNSVDEVKNAALSGLDVSKELSNATQIGLQANQVANGSGFERISDTPIYFTDSIVRRASSLHLTNDSKNALKAGLPPGLFTQLGLKEGDAIRITQGDATVVLPATLQKGLAEGVVRIPSGTPASSELGNAFGHLQVERA
jgi:NADH-quinone oxidoreductase subunit G